MRLLIAVLLLFASTNCIAMQEEPAKASETQLVGKADQGPSTLAHTSYPMAASEAAQQNLASQPTAHVVGQSGRSEYELGVTYALLGFTALALIVVAILAARAAKPWAPDSIIRVFGIVLIIPMAVLLVVAGYSEKQTAPVIGLLGVIAGYLLGHTQRSSAGG